MKMRTDINPLGIYNLNIYNLHLNFLLVCILFRILIRISNSSLQSAIQLLKSFPAFLINKWKDLLWTCEEALNIFVD